MKDENKKTNDFASLKGYQRAMPIIFAALAVFSAVCVFSKSSGFLGEGVGRILLGLFSAGGYVIPFLLGIHALCYASDVTHKRFTSRAFFSATAIILASTIEFSICSWGGEALFAPTEFYADATNGGFVGGVLGFALMKLVGGVGVIVFSVAILAIYAIFFYADRTGEFGQKALDIAGALFGFLAKTEGDVKKRIADKKNEKLEREEEAHRNRSDDLLNDSFFVTTGVEDLRIDELGIGKSTAKEEPIPEAAEPVQKRQRRNSQKPVDLDYGIETPTAAEKENDESFEKNAASAERGDIFGIEDSAEKVFTGSFDPFNFATSEKLASKPSSKATFEEELDDITMLELKGEPTDREKRMMELEKRKKIWDQRNKKPAEQPVEAPKQAEKPVEPTPHAVIEESITPPAPKAEAVTPIPEPSANIPKEVNAYTSYSSTKTTYTQPINTVEFTINGNHAPEREAVTSQGGATSFPNSSTSSEKSTEDVAAFIAEKIARANPAYARSANEMITYTKVISSHEDTTPSPESAVEVSIADEIIEIASKEAEAIPRTFDMSEEIVFEEENAPRESAQAATQSGEAGEKVSFIPPQEMIFGSEEENAESINETKATYERAASFASTLTESENTTREFAPEFKSYEPEAAYTSSVAAEAAREEETLKVERAMLSPSPEIIVEADIVEDAAVQSEESPEAPALDTDAIWTEEDEAHEETRAEELISWDEPEESAPTETEPESTDETLGFTEESDAEDDDEEGEAPATFDTTPEEDEVTDEEIPTEEQNPDVIKMREMFPFLNPIGEAPAKKVEDAVSIPVEESPTEEDDLPPFDDPVIKKAPETTAMVSMEEIKKEEKKAKKQDYSNYEFPSIELLAKEEALTDENIQAEIQENADKLIETLASFGVTASIKGVDRGPRITRYEVVPAKGVKVSSILNLQDDIALNLAAGSIRMEAPIPGKSAVGIEIPNKKSSTVRLRNLLENEEFQAAKSKTSVCIGRDVAGQPVFGDIAKMPHLLIAGATGMGKSVCINSLMISILYKARPDEVKFIMIDPKQVEFTMYNGIPHLLVPVVSDAKQAAGALMWAVEEMEKRYNLLNPLCVRNIEAYNEKVMADPSLGEPMSKIVIVIDEFADLMLQVKDPVETLVMRIAQKARAAGIYLVIGTQRPSVNVITGVIKANVPSRISCKVMSNVDSKTVLDSAGAEKLLDRGDMLFAPAGSPKPNRVQGAFVADAEVEAIMVHLKKFSDGSNYDSTVMEEIERAAQKCSKKGNSGGGDYDDGDDEVHGEGYLNDRQFLDAVEVAVNTRKISTSLIQRKLSIGYGKAAKFIDIMEDMGIVGEANGQRPREVLISPDEWREKLARATLD